MSTAAEAKKIVIKVGTSTLAHATGHINIRMLEELVKVLADLQNSGRQIILVSSGAIAVGMGKLGLHRRPSDMPDKQAAAAVGQCELMYLYDRYFSEYNHTIGQVLLTNDSVCSPQSRENVHNTFEALLAMGAIPVVNENDTVATDEIRVGDNDTLSAIVARITGADCLVILSDIDGLYTADPARDPAAELVREVPEITDAVRALAGGSAGELGTGGMITKLHAAEIAVGAGADMYIINGRNPRSLYDLIEGRPVGTHFWGKAAVNI